MFEIPKLLVDSAEIIAAIGIAGAFIYAGLAYRAAKISEEIKRSYDSFKDLKDLQASLVEHPDEYSTTFATDQWYERYFNTWEWFSFMVNKRQIKNRDVKRFFKRSLMTDYEDLFEKHFTKERIDEDGEFYPEFRELYKKLKYPSIIQRVADKFR